MAPLQGTPGLVLPEDHVPHSGTPQNPDGGHSNPCIHGVTSYVCAMFTCAVTPNTLLLMASWPQVRMAARYRRKESTGMGRGAHIRAADGRHPGNRNNFGFVLITNREFGEGKGSARQGSQWKANRPVQSSQHHPSPGGSSRSPCSSPPCHCSRSAPPSTSAYQDPCTCRHHPDTCTSLHP
jgi:hypothetical protein